MVYEGRHYRDRDQTCLEHLPESHQRKVPVAPIRRSVTVRSDPERAFALFTADMGTWWPVDAYSRAVSEFKDEGIRVVRLEFQALLGGRILEHTSDGRILPWAEVIAWHPPHSVQMAWRRTRSLNRLRRSR